ncbi:Inner membrane ALBINO3 [Klebsormidium nitens]|uniref:Inner membrane ALBINO3 n=1 Tax=Klebsormidium nitens TaxID=105231 RepID=A0A1Y1IJT0_KLENI|nr:Inner membrane ALBINO3 [Klebsormidium nitens]|eukprot:GAQ91090.1 Inner membrane ALBINO3 [Klebsormidium nitens]
MMAAAIAGPLAVHSLVARASLTGPGQCSSSLSERAFSARPLYPGILRHPLVGPRLPRKQAAGRLCQAGVVRAGLESLDVPGAISTAHSVTEALATRAHDLVYTLAADPAVTDAVQAAGDAVKNDNGGPLNILTGVMESTLNLLEAGLQTLHVPYAYGFAIILLTLLVKALTFPLTKQQVESTLNMQALAPKVKAIQERYKGDQERIQLETSRLYKTAGVNPLAGCLPTLATLPVWIGLYRALSNVASEGLLTEGFFWIPTLAGPTTIAERGTGSGTSWLFPFIDGQPPLGWQDTLAYLVLPVVLVISQFVSMQLMAPPESQDPAQKQSQAILKFLPLMIGYFSLSVPSGLSLYWLTNNVLSTAQQVYLKKGGGAKAGLSSLEDEGFIDPGKARRTTVKDLSPPPRTPGAVIDTEVTERPSAGELFRRRKEEEDAKRADRRRVAEAAQQKKDAEAAARKEEAEKRSAEAAQVEASTESEADAEGGNGAAEVSTDTSSTAPLPGDSNGGQNGAPKVGVPAGTRSKRSRRRRS